MGLIIFALVVVAWAFIHDKRSEKRHRNEADYPDVINEILYGSRPQPQTLHIQATITASDPDIKVNADNTISVQAKASELFSDAFVQSCSSFKNWSDFFDSYFPPDQDLGTVPPGDLDAFTKATTTYPDWHTMLLAASRQWTNSRFAIENPNIVEISTQTTIYKKP
jgi:hypothetical protein